MNADRAVDHGRMYGIIAAPRHGRFRVSLDAVPSLRGIG